MAENIDLVMGGIGALERATKPIIDAQHAETARQVPLSPYEKYLGMVMSGQMDMNQASILARHEMMQQGGQGTQVPSAPMPAPSQPSMPQATPPQQYGYQPGMSQMDSMPTPVAPQPPQQPSLPQQAQPSYMPMPQGQSTTQPTPPPPSYGLTQGPQTRGDMATLQASAPFLRSTRAPSDSADDKMLRLLMQLDSKEGIAGRAEEGKKYGVDVRAGSSAANLEERKTTNTRKIAVAYRAIDASLQRAQMLIDGALERVTTGGGQNLELEALKIEAADLRTQQNNFADVIQSIPNLADNTRAIEYMEKNGHELAKKAEIVKQKIETLSKKGGQQGSTTRTQHGQSSKDIGNTELPPGAVGRTSKPDSSPGKPFIAKDGTKLIARGGFFYLDGE